MMSYSSGYNFSSLDSEINVGRICLSSSSVDYRYRNKGRKRYPSYDRISSCSSSSTNYHHKKRKNKRRKKRYLSYSSSSVSHYHNKKTCNICLEENDVMVENFYCQCKTDICTKCFSKMKECPWCKKNINSSEDDENEQEIWNATLSPALENNYDGLVDSLENYRRRRRNRVGRWCPHCRRYHSLRRRCRLRIETIGSTRTFENTRRSTSRSNRWLKERKIRANCRKKLDKLQEKRRKTREKYQQQRRKVKEKRDKKLEKLRRR